MPQGSLSPLQAKILVALAGFEPPWTLTGGGALALHTAHRTTRDLDLFWRGRTTISTVVNGVKQKLEAGGLEASLLQDAGSFFRFAVRDGAESTVLDLVADPVANITAPEILRVHGHEIEVDTRHEILVNKLVAMLGRSELRDLQDIQVLLEGGGDLSLAVQQAPRKDGGFSPMTLAWLLRGFAIAEVATSAGWDHGQVQRLVAFRDELVLRITDLARP
ncbi:MAG TPA: nucleotidyl transferase AbiEii/AbiGii toxin family protein [Planctomycetota bacterium]|nr:nucleotidyl transferase AbiEii/AbiGii toxin family protein [Planctomycetota bacterium]